MIEFNVNEYITLRLTKKETFIYVMGERFLQCKYLLLNIPAEEVDTFDELISIDEAAEFLDNSLERELDIQPPLDRINKLSPETEFWGHCSNLQVWAERNYDSRLLHRNIGFPLLKKLTDIGDPLAKKVFKEEIAKRIESGFKPTITFLVEEGYLDYLSTDYIIYIMKKEYLNHLFDPLTEEIEKTKKSQDFSRIYHLIGNKYLKYLDTKVLFSLLEEPRINLIDKIIAKANLDPIEIGNWGYSFFEKVGEDISQIIRNKFLETIKKKELNKLIEYVEFSLLENLNREDLVFLLKDPEINLLDRILEGLRSPNIDSTFFIEGKLFSKKIIKYMGEILKKKISKIVKHNDLNIFSQLIGLGLLELLDDFELESLLNNPKVKLLENYIKAFDFQNSNSLELSKYSIKSESYPNEFFRKISRKFPLIFKKKFAKILRNSTMRDLIIIINYELLDFIKKKELKRILKNVNCAEKLRKAIIRVEISENSVLEKYSWLKLI